MSDNLKLLTKDYFNRYPVKEYSAARLEYSMLLMPEVMDVVDAKLPQMREMAAKRGIDIPDATELMAKVEQEEDTRKLLRMLRQTQPPVVRKAVREKLLNREEEVLPEIQRMISSRLVSCSSAHAVFLIWTLNTALMNSKTAYSEVKPPRTSKSCFVFSVTPSEKHLKCHS